MANGKSTDSKQSEESGKSFPAAYLPFRTFTSSIESLEHGIPKQIDRTIWRSQAGVVQSQILMAFRFLGLVDAFDEPTPLLHEYVEQKDRRKESMAKILKEAYAEVIKHDLTKMTPKMLDDEFDVYDVSGDTKRKAVTFFLKAAKFADIPMHPLLSSQVRNSGPRGKRQKRSEEGAGSNSAQGASQNQSGGFSSSNTRTVNLQSGGTVTITVAYDPFSLSLDDRKFVFGLVDQLQSYATGTAQDDNDSEEEEEDQ